MRILTVLLFALLFAACGKDRFDTKPTLEIKEVSSTMAGNQSFSASLEFTDREGDVSDTLYVFRQRINRSPVTAPVFRYQVPEFPTTSKGEIKVDIANSFFLSGINAINIPGSTPVRRFADTILVGFVLKDKANNRSDTARTIVVAERL